MAAETASVQVAGSDCKGRQNSIALGLLPGGSIIKLHSVAAADLLRRAKINDFRFHDRCHTSASWYMMNGGGLYELAKILGHSNIKMTERYAKLGKQYIARTGNTAREMWRRMAASERGCSLMVSTNETLTLEASLSC